MTYKQLIAYYKTQQAAADALGIQQPSVAGWKSSGIPMLRQFQYQDATKGALKVAKK